MILLSISLSVWSGVLLRKASERECVGSTSMAGSVCGHTGSLRSSQGHMRLLRRFEHLGRQARGHRGAVLFLCRYGRLCLRRRSFEILGFRG